MSGDVTPYIDNLTSEHVSKTNFVATVTASVQPSADLKASYSAIPELYDIDNAVGQQLDVVGQWVGASRDVETPLTGVYFALDTAGLGFDSGVWQGPYDPSTGLTQLPDEFYKLVLRARILNNVWDGSREQLYTLANLVFLPYGFTYFVDDHADLTITIGILGATAPTPILTALLNSGALDVKPATIQVIARVAQQGPIFAFDLNTLYFQGFDLSYWS